jgi:hypothetical protein
VRPGPGGAVEVVRGALGDGDGACGSNAREKREKERAGPSTIPAYVRRADTSANEHKRLAYVAAVAPYVIGHLMNISYIRRFKNRRT